MKESLRTRSFVVYDDVLAPADYAQVWEFMQLESYKPVHSERWEKVWRLGDGLPLAGPGIFTRKSEATSHEADARYYPTHRGIDKVIECILAKASTVADLVGHFDKDWSFLTAKAFLYPSDTGLAWHVDSKIPTGAYVFYSHPKWKSGWGGELLIADDTCFGQELDSYKVATTARVVDGKVVGLQREEVPSAFDDRKANAVLSARGVGYYIQPKANRLVVMRNGIPHCIAKVDRAAGENVRCSVAGFFQP
jgi:hypothetical protein